MPPRRRNQDSGGDSPKPAAPKSFWESLFAIKDTVLQALGFTAKATGVAVAIGTDEGRALVGEAWGVVADGFTAAVNFTEEMVRRKTRYSIWTFSHAAISLLISGFVHDWGPRIFWLMVVFLSLVITSVISAAGTARWWMTTGAIWRGLEKTDADKVVALAHFNPLPLLFTSVQPAVEGGLRFLWDYVRFLARVCLHYAIGSLFLWQPFHTNPALLLMAPFIILIFIFLAVGYDKATKWNLWYVYLFAPLFLMNVMSVLAWNPWIIHLMMTGEGPDGLTSPEKASLVISVLLLIVAWHGVKWATNQHRQNQGEGGSGRGGSKLNGSPLLGPAVAGGIAIALVLVAFNGISGATDHFHKVTGILQPWLAKHNFDQTGGGIRGTDAIAPAAPVQYQTVIRSAGEYEISEHKRSLPVRIGPMDAKVDLQSGDSVFVHVETTTYDVYDVYNNRVTLRLAGAIKNGMVATPEDYPDKMDCCRNDYPSVRLPDNALLGRVGDGEVFFVGQEYTGQVHGSGPFRFVLNLPVKHEFQGAVVENQTINLTITVKRARRA